jgi:hypothetical protein
MGMIIPKENRYVAGRQRHYPEIAGGRSARPHVNRLRAGEWEHTAPGGDVHAGCWQDCKKGACGHPATVAA